MGLEDGDGLGTGVGDGWANFFAATLARRTFEINHVVLAGRFASHYNHTFKQKAITQGKQHQKQRFTPE
jgi:hypothetical protein